MGGSARITNQDKPREILRASDVVVTHRDDDTSAP
jgi:hypothetical protein